MTKAFAIYHTWPDLRNAEYEVLQRIIGAAKNIDSEVALIDNSGSVLWATPGLKVPVGKELPVDAVDFAISLHFESPRTCDVYTYYALWQPIKFYHDFGYQVSIDKLSTHNDVLSCHSDIADAHALNIFSGLRRPPITPLETLFHSLPQPFLPPNVSADSKLFYVGINWERIGRPKGRYHDTLVMLDNKELIEIYGPEEIHGVAPWGGFQTYQGELPFDGHSIRTAINSSGICLALSSEAHKSTGIMSNRLFEGFASGAAVIATPNPLIDKYFSDVVYLVDDERGEAMLGQQILSALRAIRADPEEAKRRILRGQEILREVCALEKSLEGIFQNNSARKKEFSENFLDDTEVTVVVDATAARKEDVSKQIDQLREQIRSIIDLHVICSDAYAGELDASPSGSLRTIRVHGRNLSTEPVMFDGVRGKVGRVGPIIADILKTVETPYFALLGASDLVFSEHFASAARAIRLCPGSSFAATGTISVQRSLQGSSSKTLESARFTDVESILVADGIDRRGRFLFSSDLLKPRFDTLLSLLDGQEFRYFLLAALLEGPLAQTGYATHIHDDYRSQPFEPSESIANQQQYIRDHFMQDGRWLSRLARDAKLPEFVYAYSPGTPMRWSRMQQNDFSTKLIEADVMHSAVLGGTALKHLQEGFSHPEEGGTWLTTGPGRLSFALGRKVADAPEDYELVIEMLGRRSAGTGRRQHCTVMINKVAVAYVEVAEGWTEHRFRIPPSLRRENQNMQVELIPDHAEVVTDERGHVIDPRHLSILVRSIGVMRDRRHSLPVLRIGEVYPCVEQSLGSRALVHGFHAPESNLTWVAGTRGEIAFRLEGEVRQPVVQLKLSGRRMRTSGAPQMVEVSVGSRVALTAQLNENPKIVKIPLLEDEAKRPVELSLSLSHAEPVLDDVQNIIDPRLLGAGVFELSVVDETVQHHSHGPAKKRSIFSRLSSKGEGA
ncbi:hypothetical protein AB3M93_19520 [Novosphingobium panipatense]|uniref:glycosyltransferase family protein n=1 Tax=Novosphingobium panipatense TaxID=428991 RepID=UPI0039A034AC